MTDEELKVIRSSVEAARIPDDWDESQAPDGPICVICGCSYTLDCDGTAEPTPDCHSCAHALAANYRTDVPRLLEYIDKLRELLQQYEG